MTPDAGTRLAAPRPALARDRIATARERGGLVTLHGRCRIDGATTGPPAERVVLAKPDGALVAHAHDGARPCLQQPPGGGYEPRVVEDSLQIVCDPDQDGRPVTVRFETVASLAIHGATVEDAGDVDHAALVERVLERPELVEPGFRPLATERETAAGRIDVYGEDEDGDAVAVEVKRRRAGPDAVGQLARYVDALAADLHAEKRVRGVLVAPSATDAARRRLADRGFAFARIEESLEVAE